MPLLRRWLLISVGGGGLITITFFVFPKLLFANLSLAEAVGKVLFWPVAVCVHLSGPGASLGGSPERFEATPVQIVAAILGIGLTWVFYSSLVFLIVWLRSRRRLLRPTVTRGK
jgi:hypothetical protein